MVDMEPSDSPPDGNEMVGSRSSASHFKTPKVPTGPRRRSDFVSHGSAVTGRRWVGSCYSNTEDQVGATGDDQHASNTYQWQQQQQSMLFSALPPDEESQHHQPQTRNSQLRTRNSTNTYSTDPPSSLFADQPGRLSDPVQRSPASQAHSLSISDADKLQQQQGQENVSGDYRGDRLPSRYSFNETVVPDVQHVARNPGSYPAERMQNFQPHFNANTSPTSSAYNRRPVSWSDDFRPQSQASSCTGCCRGESAASAAGFNSESRRALESVQRAADDIIKQKDQIIEWQKRQLEMRQGFPIVTPGAAAAAAAVYSDMSVNMRLQDLQYENASLKAKLAELYAAQKCDKEAFDRKLGAAEFELQELKLSVGDKLRGRDGNVKQLQKKLDDKSAELSECERKVSELSAERESLLKQSQSAKRYLEGLPTADEHADNLQQIKSLTAEKKKLEGDVNVLEKKVKDVVKGQGSRDALIATLQSKLQALQQLIDDGKKENESLKAALSADKDVIQLQKLQHLNSQLRDDCDKAKKLLEVKSVQLQQLQASSTQQIKSLEERLEQEETTVTGLRQELTDKEQQLQTATQSHNDLSRDHQRLMQRSLQLEDQITTLRQQNSTELTSLQRQLLSDMSLCALELDAIITVCLQSANGDEPNLSCLLSIPRSSSHSSALAASSSSEGESNANSIAAVKHQLNKLRELRLDVDKLRSMVTDKLAEDMGRRLTCNPQ